MYAAARQAARPAGCCMRTSERGFSYLLLLFMLVLSGVALAALGENMSLGMQREREAELRWRGTEIARALDRYHAVAVNGAARYPDRLEDLLADRRLAEPRYHLRRLYLDPYSGRADWALLRDAQGGIVGVHSRSSARALARIGLPPESTESTESTESAEPGETGASDNPDPAAGRPVPRVSRWHFMAGADAPAAASVSAPLVASTAAPGSVTAVRTGTVPVRNTP